jgi:hypothetical protein
LSEGSLTLAEVVQQLDGYDDELVICEHPPAV